MSIQDSNSLLGDGRLSSTVNDYETLLVSDAHLKSVESRPRFFEYLEALWHRRFFIHAEARSKAFSTGRGTFLGRMWIILQPLLEVGVYALIFGVVLNVSRGIENFLGFLVIGVIFFGFISRGLTRSAGLIQSSRGLISSFSFPRAAIAFSAVLRSLLDNLTPAIVAVTLALLFQSHKPVSWTIVLIIPIFLLIHIFILGATLIIARMTAFVPDFKSLVSLFVRALFFVSGVFFSIERFSGNGMLQDIMSANPVYQFLKVARESVMYATVPSLETWLYLIAWSFGLLAAGLIYFWRAEARYSNVR